MNKEYSARVNSTTLYYEWMQDAGIKSGVNCTSYFS